jgi:parallel beta-helix repeat protein
LNATASTISNNTASEDGGGIYVDGCGATINITNSTVSNNTSVFDGGGIEVFCSTVNLTGATFSHNTASDDNAGGLAVYDGSTLVATASSIISNTAGDGDGGGINANDSFVTLTNTSLNWNTASGWGGGIEFGDPFGCNSNNCAPVNGASTAAARGPHPSTARPRHHAGAVARQAPVVVFEGLDLETSTVEHNTAQFGAGGGIDNYACDSASSPVVINNSTVALNRATGSDLDTDSGGGGYSQYGTDCGGDTVASLVATNSQFGGNTANSSVGGAIFNVNYGQFTSTPGAGLVTLAQTPVMRLPMYLNDNQAEWGGGIFNYGDGANTTLQPGAHVIKNHAFFNGGGVFNDCASTLTVAPGALIAFNTPNQVFTNLGPCLLD